MKREREVSNQEDTGHHKGELDIRERGMKIGKWIERGERERKKREKGERKMTP